MALSQICSLWKLWIYLIDYLFFFFLFFSNSFGYIYIDPQGVDGGDLWKSFEIDGLPITLTKASPKLCFEAEIVGKKKVESITF